MSLDKIATVLRALQLYAHHAHNNCTGKSFIPDHKLFSATYTEAEVDYDSVIERIIGSTGKPVDTLSMGHQALKLAEQCSKQPGDCNTEFLKGVLKLELATCVYIDKCIESEKLPEGTKQLIGNIADKSMSRQYKLRQRLQW
jgi:DNA-binding ferritin-like protein